MLQTGNPLPRRNGRVMELYFCFESTCGEEYCFLATHIY